MGLENVPNQRTSLILWWFMVGLLIHLSPPTQSNSMSGGGGCNILGMFCKKKKDVSTVSTYIEDKAVMDNHHVPVGMDPRYCTG